MYRNIFDSHAHYESAKFNPGRDEVITALPGKGIKYLMNAGSDLTTSLQGISLAEKYDFICCSVGIHPHAAKDAPPGFTQELARLAAEHPKVKAIGEAGLDYHYDFSPRDTQREVFEQQLILAEKTGLPIIVHSRKACQDTLELLKKYRPAGVVHCFGGSAETARKIIDLGMYIGFTGVVTFKNARKTLEAVRAVPLERLLIETDCPYMAPEPKRGMRCDSSLLGYIAETIAREKGLEPQTLIDITTQNAEKLYGI